ncbi:hypothetical protein SAMN04489727_2174 [Amycolatopsis tolypomycina]|uniref:Uncharacterized protein n=1 Tax=Amycolatopsis tolypomycina TaxID=208445 RepID=A0A1H4NWK0_9PSEU|nr:hypothetical protein SAMN04489727_2174 [Amycolatopsis tolypomycina]
MAQGAGRSCATSCAVNPVARVSRSRTVVISSIDEAAQRAAVSALSGWAPPKEPSLARASAADRIRPRNTRRCRASGRSTSRPKPSMQVATDRSCAADGSRRSPGCAVDQLRQRECEGKRASSAGPSRPAYLPNRLEAHEPAKAKRAKKKIGRRHEPSRSSRPRGRDHSTEVSPTEMVHDPPRVRVAASPPAMSARVKRVAARSARVSSTPADEMITVAKTITSSPASRTRPRFPGPHRHRGATTAETTKTAASTAGTASSKRSRCDFSRAPRPHHRAYRPSKAERSSPGAAPMRDPAANRGRTASADLSSPRSAAGTPNAAGVRPGPTAPARGTSPARVRLPPGAASRSSAGVRLRSASHNPSRTRHRGESSNGSAALHPHGSGLVLTEASSYAHQGRAGWRPSDRTGPRGDPATCSGATRSPRCRR